MKKHTRTQSSQSRTITRELLLTRKLGRLGAFLVLALAATALAVSTVVWAKTQKKAKKPKPEITLRAESESESESESHPRRANTRNLRERKPQGPQTNGMAQSSLQGEGNLTVERKPREESLKKGREFNGDLRDLPQIPPDKVERPEREGPAPHPRVYGTAPQRPQSNLGSKEIKQLAKQHRAHARSSGAYASHHL